MRRAALRSPRAVPPARLVETALARCALTSGLSPADRARVERIATVRRLRRSQLLFSAGEPCAAMYVVAEGSVKVFNLAPDGREHVVHLFRAGESFAEAALFGEGVYPAGAQALAPTTLVSLPRAALLDLLRVDTGLCLRLLAGLSIKLKTLRQRLEDAAFQSAGARLAAYLLDERQRQGRALLRLPLAKKDLAAWLAMSPETLSRLLRALRDASVLSIHGRQLRLRDPDALRDVATGRRLPADDAA